MKVKVWLSRKNRTSIWNAVVDYDVEVESRDDIEDMLVKAVELAIEKGEEDTIDILDINSEKYYAWYNEWKDDEAFKDYSEEDGEKEMYMWDYFNYSYISDLNMLVDLTDFRYEFFEDNPQLEEVEWKSKQLDANSDTM